MILFFRSRLVSAFFNQQKQFHFEQHSNNLASISKPPGLKVLKIILLILGPIFNLFCLGYDQHDRSDCVNGKQPIWIPQVWKWAESFVLCQGIVQRWLAIFRRPFATSSNVLWCLSGIFILKWCLNWNYLECLLLCCEFSTLIQYLCYSNLFSVVVKKI